MKLDIGRYTDFLFDFDGVIVDSVNVKTAAFAELYGPFGDSVVSRVIRHHISHGGMSRFEKFRHYHKDYLGREISETEIAELARRFSELTVDKVLKAPFIKGAPEFLGILKRNNKSMFVVSGAPEDEIKKIVEKKYLGQYFADVKGSPRSKKSNIEYLLKKHGIKSSASAYFGDSEEDQNAANGLDIDFVPINYFSGKMGYKDFTCLL